MITSRAAWNATPTWLVIEQLTENPSLKLNVITLMLHYMNRHNFMNTHIPFLPAMQHSFSVLKFRFYIAIKPKNRFIDTEFSCQCCWIQLSPFHTTQTHPCSTQIKSKKVATNIRNCTSSCERKPGQSLKFTQSMIWGLTIWGMLGKSGFFTVDFRGSFLLWKISRQQRDF